MEVMVLNPEYFTQKKLVHPTEPNIFDIFSQRKKLRFFVIVANFILVRILPKISDRQIGSTHSALSIIDLH